MQKNLFSFVIAVLLGALIVATPLTAQSVQAKPNNSACWGQATKVFAKTGELGKHASQQPNPRVGLRNLARALFELGELPDDSIQALGAFVSVDVSACIYPE